ncbi:MAG TPA: hypothetical protein PK020_22115 [Ilumatobacteraceae bacterium]|nr:hypothetical protein [Ilumatobacteraceae bacterium]
MKRSITALAIATVAGLSMAGTASAIPTSGDYWLASGNPTHTDSVFYTGTGSQRSRQTCVSAGHGSTYYGPWVSVANVVSHVPFNCYRSSISAYGQQLA